MPLNAPRELADGKLLLDEPAEGVVRLTISNPAKRNALDHPILDAITATLGELASGGAAADSVPPRTPSLRERRRPGAPLESRAPAA